MPKDKLAILVAILIAVIIGETIFFGFRLNQEKQKTAFFSQENSGKDANSALIQVKIKEDTPEGQYNDSLYYTAEQWASKTPKDIEADKKARVDKWLSIIKNPTPAVEPTKEELQVQADELQRQAEELKARITNQ